MTSIQYLHDERDERIEDTSESHVEETPSRPRRSTKKAEVSGEGPAENAAEGLGGRNEPTVGAIPEKDAVPEKIMVPEGVMRLENIPSPEAIRAFYHTIAAPDGFQEHMYEEPWHRWRLDRTKEILRLVLLFVPGARVIEVGCADGILTEWLVGQGCHAVGIDVARPAIERCEKRGLKNAEFFCGTLAEWIEAKEAEGVKATGFDLAIASSVLEHVLDPVGEIRLLTGVAKWILASVPINESPNPDAFNPELTYHPRKCADGTGHIWYWRPDSFRAMFGEVVLYEDNGVNAILVGR
jgi:hypothetical protein